MSFWVHCKLKTDSILFFHTKPNQTVILYNRPRFIAHAIAFACLHTKLGHFIRFVVVASIGHTTYVYVCVLTK